MVILKFPDGAARADPLLPASLRMRSERGQLQSGFMIKSRVFTPLVAIKRHLVTL